MPCPASRRCAQACNPGICPIECAFNPRNRRRPRRRNKKQESGADRKHTGHEAKASSKYAPGAELRGDWRETNRAKEQKDGRATDSKFIPHICAAN